MSIHDIPGCLTDEDFLIFVEHLDLGAGEIHEYRESDRRDAVIMLAYTELSAWWLAFEADLLSLGMGVPQ